MITSARVVSFPSEKNPTVIYPTDGALALAPDFSPVSAVRKIRRAAPVKIVPFPGAFERAQTVSPSIVPLAAPGLCKLIRSRYYDPNLGRFTSEDPRFDEVLKSITPHLYIYVENNPLNRTDPSGESPLTDVAISAGIAGSLSGMANAALLGEKIGAFRAFLIGFAGGAVGGGIGAAGTAAALSLGSVASSSLISFINGLAAGDDKKQIALDVIKSAIFGLGLAYVGGHLSGAFKHKLVDEIASGLFIADVEIIYSDVEALASAIADAAP